MKVHITVSVVVPVIILIYRLTLFEEIERLHHGHWALDFEDLPMNREITNCSLV